MNRNAIRWPLVGLIMAVLASVCLGQATSPAPGLSEVPRASRLRDVAPDVRLPPGVARPMDATSVFVPNSGLRRDGMGHQESYHRTRPLARIVMEQVAEEIPAEELELLQRWTSLTEQIANQTDEEPRKGLVAELHKTLESIFDRDLAARESELFQLESRVKKLRETLDLRKQSRDRIVQWQVDSVVLPSQGLAFPGTPMNQNPLPVPSQGTFPGTPWNQNPLPDPTPGDFDRDSYRTGIIEGAKFGFEDTGVSRD